VQNEVLGRYELGTQSSQEQQSVFVQQPLDEPEQEQVPFRLHVAVPYRIISDLGQYH